VGINVTMAAVIVVVIGRASVPDAVMTGLAALGGLALIYQGASSASERRAQQLGWLAFVQVVFVALSGI
jgi:hypothetical protein